MQLIDTIMRAVIIVLAIPALNLFVKEAKETLEVLTNADDD